MLPQVMADEPPTPDDDRVEADSPAAIEAPEGAARTRSSTAGGVGGWIAFGTLVVVLVGIVGVSVAGGSSTASGPKACGATVTDALDPNSVVRVLPTARELEYTTNPPSSGAFVVGPQVDPVSTTELRPPVQVGLLARGMVLLQYQPDAVSADDLALLKTLAGDSVVVSPNADMKTPIVATAWLKRMTCTAVDTSALKKFATVNANRAPADLSATTTTGG